jgi:hypothetical protein
MSRGLTGCIEGSVKVQCRREQKLMMEVGTSKKLGGRSDVVLHLAIPALRRQRQEVTSLRSACAT